MKCIFLTSTEVPSSAEPPCHRFAVVVVLVVVLHCNSAAIAVVFVVSSSSEVHLQGGPKKPDLFEH